MELSLFVQFLQNIGTPVGTLLALILGAYLLYRQYKSDKSTEGINISKARESDANQAEKISNTAIKLMDEMEGKYDEMEEKYKNKMKEIEEIKSELVVINDLLEEERKKRKAECEAMDKKIEKILKEFKGVVRNANRLHAQLISVNHVPVWTPPNEADVDKMVT